MILSYMLPDDSERLSIIEELIETLIELNKKIPVIVEGKNDEKALRRLGLVGKIIPFHRGINLYEFSEGIHERFTEAILLLDWDMKGEELQKRLGEYLKGMWEEFSVFRNSLKLISRGEIHGIEDIPGFIKRLRERCEAGKKG